MSGTKVGGKRASETNKARYGEDFYQVIGKRGGMVCNPNKGFGGNLERASIAGKKGGSLSKRRPVSAQQRKEAARRRAHKDFQVGFNEESSNWYQNVTRRFK